MRDQLRRKKKATKSNLAARSSGRGIADGLVFVLLLGIVLGVFGQTLWHDFVNYDDEDYVLKNPYIKNGLNIGGIGWAFTHVHAGNWHPLTTISHMLDCQLYGLQPWGHHLTNVLLHAAAVILLFLALRELTNTHWPGAFVAAVFAVHPLHVESVAWIAERKDVLSGVFFMLTLWAYARFARSNRPAWGLYSTVIFFYALGIMCKPTLVTLPFVLLLLDYWPLRRFTVLSPGAGPNRTRSIQYLLVEKIPFFVLSAVSCIATLLAQGMTAVRTEELTFSGRISNALVSYVLYLGQMIWPTDLAAFYPHPVAELNIVQPTDLTAFYPHPVAGLSIVQILLASLILVIISAVSFVWRKKYPFLLVGWLWFLGMLVPMVGLVQVGIQARADRYTYLSQIGLYLLVTWAALELFAKSRHGAEMLRTIAVLIISGLTIDSYFQARSWRDSEALWRHALAHTASNYMAHSGLADALLKKGRLDEAIVHFRKAVEISDDYSGHNTFGDALMKNGQVDEAILHFRRAIELYPNFPVAHGNLGNAFLAKGDLVDAIASFRTALQIQPNYVSARNNLGISLAKLGKTEEAQMEFREILRIDPTSLDAHCNLATLLLQLGQRDEAIAHLREASRLKPDDEKVNAQLRQFGAER